MVGVEALRSQGVVELRRCFDADLGTAKTHALSYQALLLCLTYCLTCDVILYPTCSTSAVPSHLTLRRGASATPRALTPSLQTVDGSWRDKHYRLERATPPRLAGLRWSATKEYLR